MRRCRPGSSTPALDAAFKALLFLAAGCVIRIAGTGLLAQQGGLLRRNPRLAWLFGLGLAGLAGLPPLGGFWSKEAVLAAAEEGVAAGAWTGWLVLLSGLLTTLVTGLYAGRAWAMVALGEPPAQEGEERALPAGMTWPLVVLAVPTALLGLVLLAPPAAWPTCTGPKNARSPARAHPGRAGLVAVRGRGWASGRRLAMRSAAARAPDDRVPLDDVQDSAVVRPVRAWHGWSAPATGTCWTRT